MEYIDKKLEILLNKIVLRFEPDKVILFGSRAKNEHHKDSDYDLCILKNDIDSKKQLTKELYGSLIGSFMAVDLIVEKTSEFEELKTNPFLIYREISENGVVVYER